jgi:hypothetical protein
MTTLSQQTPRSHVAEYLQTAMVVALIAGVVGFLAAAWSPAGSPDVRAERNAPAASRLA